ncbi:histidine phosphatase family protein [Oxalobacteraceae bacterium CAVE-383]|nr:histidine phosphatase family protein [Oxalobacteraceae bacterium CAVE-383]
MTIRLLLVAHAATAAMRSGRFPGDAPRDAVDLRRAGDQAALAALRERLPAAGEAAALCSPAACARDTAAALGLPAQEEAGLADMDYGRWQGRRLDDFGVDEAAQLAQWSRDPRAAPHGGESFEAVLARVGAWLDGLDRIDMPSGIIGAAGRVVIAVTHAPVIRAAAIHALNAPPASFARIEVAPLSVVELRRAGRVGGWRWWTGAVDGRL